jgi:hypothetical protein
LKFSRQLSRLFLQFFAAAGSTVTIGSPLGLANALFQISDLDFYFLYFPARTHFYLPPSSRLTAEQA